MIPADLVTAVEGWIAEDPDDRDREELRDLLRCGATAELRDRFCGRLRFGTAGLRGEVAAGPNRMNRAVVRAATAAVAGWLLASGASGPARGVVVGCDARHRSGDFADEAARVLAGAGIPVLLLPRPCPTPLLAFAVRHLAAAAGIMITASHNPAADNGYKLYLSDGAQVIPPADADIERRISLLGPLSAIPVADLAGPLVTLLGDEIAEAYLSAVAVSRLAATAGAAAATPRDVAEPGAVSPPRVVYTPMHGVAGDLMLRAIQRAGFAAPHVVAAQAEPDPDFPTVAFPNPEEPGALDLALADAVASGAGLVLASDPDGDRLAVAVPDGEGRWRTLTGDQLGALLGAELLEARPPSAGPPGSGTPGTNPADAGPDRVVASTIVSSTLLAKIAAAAGARYAETLTGFKWIARAADGGGRFVFGYEEALGYAVGDAVRDKDGIGAALAVLRLTASCGSVLDRYDELEAEHGVHLTSQLSLRIQEPATVMRRLRATPPAEFGGLPVEAITDYASGKTGLPRSDVLSYRLRGARVVIRPSGTEPKVKAYLEVVRPVPPGQLAQTRAAAARTSETLRAAVKAILG